MATRWTRDPATGMYWCWDETPAVDHSLTANAGAAIVKVAELSRRCWSSPATSEPTP